ncbi:MAG: winged helix DNA-binding domain-containing protein [Actinomycetota bacterium]|nr:winged helix DNA-binding domain-containing protein [Actinomycetota bacterium]
MTWPQVLAWRMRRQHLDPRDGLDAVEIARRLGGIQAQVASSAEQAVAVRRAGHDGPLVADAIADRRLIKTWAMRGTLHLLPPDEAGAYLALIAARRTWESASWQKAFGATPAQVEAMAEVAGEVLADRLLTREELIAEITDRLAAPELAAALGSGWSALLKPLAWLGVLCQGPPQGTKVTFTSPASWAPSWQGLADVDVAARAAVRAYLGAYGPADPAAFDAWLTRGQSRKAEVRRWFEAASDDLITVEVAETTADPEAMASSADAPPPGGRVAYLLAEHLDELAATQASDVVRLLPGFDQYVLGPGTGAVELIAPHRRALVSRPAGWISPVVVHGGRVVGVWDPTDTHADIRLWSDIPDEGLTHEVARWSTHLGRALDAQTSRI